MNLEELQIKIGIELKELNKQLKKASDDINNILGPKATKKMMSDNNKVIKDGFKVMEKTTKDSAKQINKDLTRAFDIDKTLVKFNKNIDRSMEQAKRSVRSACNDIRKELNAALNVKADIRVSSSTSVSRQSSGSRSDTAAILASSQYTAAMIVKAINAMINTNNKNTTRLENTMNKCTDKIIAALNKLNKKDKPENKSKNTKENKAKTTTKNQEQSHVNKVNKTQQKVKPQTTTTKGQTIGQPYGPNYKPLIDALKNAYKTINILNRNLSALNALKNIKQLGTGSNGANQLQGGTVNWTNGRQGATTTSFKGEVANPVATTIPVEPFKQIQDIIEVINYEIKDFETALVKVNSRAVSVVNTLKDFRLSNTGGYPLRGEVIDSGKLTQNKGIPQKEVIIPAEFKVIDDELQQQINEAVKNIKMPKLLNTQNFGLGEEGILDSSQVEALKQVHELKQKINSTPLGLDIPEDKANIDRLQTLFDSFNHFEKQFSDLTSKIADTINNATNKPLNEGAALKITRFLISEYEALGKKIDELIPKFKKLEYAGAATKLKERASESLQNLKDIEGLIPGNLKPQKPQRPEGFTPKQGIPGQLEVDIKVNDEAAKKLESIKEQIGEIRQEFDFMANEELVNFAIDENLFKEQFGSIEEYASDLYDLYESLQKLDDERIKLDIDTEDAKKQIKELQEIIATYIDSISNGEFKNNIKATLNIPEKTQGTRPNKPNKSGKPPKPTIMGFGLGGFKNELDQLVELAKKAGSKIKKALSDSNSQTLGFAPYQNEMHDLAETAKNVGAKIKNSLSNLNIKTPAFMTSFKDKLVSLGGLAKKYGGEFKKAFKEQVSDLSIKFPRNNGTDFSAHVQTYNQAKVFETLKKTCDKASASIEKRIKNMGKKIKSTLKGALSGIASTAKSMWSKITNAFKKGAKDCETSVSSLKGSMNGLGSLLRNLVGMFGLYRLGSVFVEGTKQAIKYEASLMTIKRTLGGASKALIDFANNNAQAFGISKSQVMEFGNIFSVIVSNFEKDGTKVASTTQKLLESAGIIAGATGYDVNQVLENLRSGILGSSEAVDQLGLNLKIATLESSQSFKEIGKGAKSWNDLTEAQKQAIIAQEIINQTTAKYGGILKNTSSMHNAFMAQVSNTKLALGQLGKALYTAILPALTALMKLLEKVFTYAAQAVTSVLSLFGITVDFASGMQGIDDSFTPADGAKDSIDDTTDSLEEATEAAEKFKGSLMGFDEINVLTDNTNKNSDSSSESGDIGGGIGEITTPEISETESVFDKLSDKMKAFLDEILEPFKNAWALLGDRWKQEWADLVESFKNFCDSLATFLKSVWDNGGKEFVQHMAEIALAVGIAAMEIGGEILDSLARLWQHLDPSTNMNTQGLLDALNEVSVKLRDFILGLGDHFESLMANGGQDVLNALGDCFMNLGEAATRGFGVVIDAIDGLIDHLDPAINENTRNMLQSLADMFHATGQTALDFVSLLESALGNGGQDMINAFGDMLMNLGDTAASVITTMMESFSAFFDYIDPAKNDITKAMMKAWEEAFLAIGDMALGFADLFDSVMANGGQEVLNKLGDAFNSLLGLVGTVVKEIADALNGLFEHLDPKTNEFTQGMLKAWQDAFDGISDMAKDIGKVLSSAMDNGGQDLVNAIGDLAMKVSGAFGKVVDTVAECVGNLFKHLDPAENDIAKGAIKSFEYFIDSIGDFVDSLAKSLKTFMDNGGQEFVNNVADIILLIGDLAFTIGGDILSAISKFMDSWLGHAVISTCATALELVSEVLKGLFEILEPLSPLISGVVAAFAGFQVASKVVGFISTIVTAFKALAGAGGILALVQGGFSALWAVIVANPIAATVAAIAAIGVAIVALYNKCEGFRDFIDGILKGFSGLFEAIKKHFGTLLEDVRNIFGNVIDIIVGIFTGDGEKVGTAVRELLGNILKLFGDLVVALFDIGVNLIEGLVKGIWECIKSIPKLLAGIGDFIVGFFKGLFGIHSPSTVFAELGTFLMEGLIEGILSSEGSIANAFVKISKTIIEGTKDIVKDVSDKFKEMKETIKEKLDEAKEVVSEKWKDIKQTVSEKAKEIYDNTKEKWSSVKETISEKAKESYQIAKENWANIKQTVSEKTKETYNSIKENWANVKQTAVNIFTGTYEATKENWSNIKDTIADKTKSAYEAAKDKWADIKQVTTDRFKESYETVKDRFTNIRDAVKEKATKTYEDVSNAWTKIKDDAGKKLEQIRTDAEKKYNDVKTTLVTKIGEAKDGIVSKWEEVRTKTNECIENVKTTAESSYENVKQTIAKKLDEVRSNTSSKWEEIKKNTGDAVERVRQEAENKYNAVKNSMVSTLENARKEMLTKWDAIKSEAITRATEAAENASTKFADIKTKISSKMDEVKSTLDTKWENIKSQTSTKASDVAKKAESAFSNIGSTAGKELESARTTINNGLSKITSLFSKTKWSLPNIKLPHFKITGGFSLNPPSVPKFGVEWYKRGGIIDGITPLGFTGGTMHMGGEAGSELVMPLENTPFTSKIAKALGQAVDNAMARNYNNNSNNSNPFANNNGDIILQVDGREFARCSINQINKLQAESGRTLLNI